MLNVYLLLLSGLMSEHASKSNTILDGDPKQVVAVVPIVNTMITQKEKESLDNLLKEVEKNDNVKALVLRIDTPGGEVGASAREICRKSSTKDRWKKDERWAMPSLSSLKDKKLIETNPAGAYRIPPKEEDEEEEKKGKK